ncbi:MAG: tRNA preQ1(34) S-adenosylmethionine ribosyltransferase-isomerase QueA [Gemmatimonadetes bacterium]|nr:tRNA preQ1(34) S-adenosylmethionine ribosyltransferase-isomerase QueA [Gemmatimonadota bacterium]
MRVADLDFDLPSDRIAQRPLPRRDAARLLVLHRREGRIEDRRFRDFPAYFDRGDLIVLNETRVLPARLEGSRSSGGRVEVLLTRNRGEGRWEALVRPGRRIREGEEIRFGSRIAAQVDERLPDGGRLLTFVGGGDLGRSIAAAGSVPLPPYIRRAPSAADRRRYQTLYARKAGAVAAPTAGLHFTAATFQALAQRGVRVARICLHVGPGTFRPVTVEDPSLHRMDAEPFEIGARAAAAIAAARASGGRICGVGTTSVRTLESAARRWRTPRALAGETDLCIRPPFAFRLTDCMLTNFHVPRSTPLLLVAALVGPDLLREAYAHALRAGYRFYSYGDAMLIL